MLDGLTTPRSVGGLSPRDRNIATTTSGLLAHANPAAGARVKKSHVRIRMSASGLRSLDAAQQPDQEEEQDERKHNEQDKSGAPAPPPGGKFMELFRCREAAWQRIVTTEARVEDEPSWDAVVLRKRRLQSNEDDKAVQSPLLLRCWCLEAKVCVGLVHGYACRLYFSSGQLPLWVILCAVEIGVFFSLNRRTPFLPGWCAAGAAGRVRHNAGRAHGRQRQDFRPVQTRHDDWQRALQGGQAHAWAQRARRSDPQGQHVHVVRWVVLRGDDASVGSSHHGT